MSNRTSLADGLQTQMSTQIATWIRSVMVKFEIDSREEKQGTTHMRRPQHFGFLDPLPLLSVTPMQLMSTGLVGYSDTGYSDSWSE